MVYDCFPFFNELELLELRLNVLDGVVDKFVLSESTRTFTNEEKPLYYEQNKVRFGKFADKILHVVVDTFPEIHSDWTIENYQRNVMIDALKNCDPEDVILISDLDEIPNPDVIRAYQKDGIKKLQQDSYSYFLNYRGIIGKYWTGTRILQYRDILEKKTEIHSYEYSTFLEKEINEGSTLTKIRIINDFPVIKRGGWHFTYLGGFDRIRYKLSSFAHQEFNNEEYASDEAILKGLRKGYDLFRPRDNRFVPVAIGKSHPEYLRDNIAQYAHLIYPFNGREAIRGIGIRISAYVQYYLFRKPYMNLRKIAKAILKGHQ